MATTFENKMNAVVDGYIEMLVDRLSANDKILRELLFEFSINPTNELYEAIVAKSDEIANFLGGFLQSAVMYSFTASAKETLAMLVKANIDGKPIDPKTAQILLRDAVGGIQEAFATAKIRLKQFMKLNANTGITGQDLSAVIAEGLIRDQDIERAKVVIGELLKRDPNIIDPIKARDYIARQIAIAERRASNTRSQAVIDQMRDLQQSLREGKIIQIVGKDGKLRNYQPDKYAEMLVRTRTAQAQVKGTLATGESFGIEYYRVTKHLLSGACDICGPYDGQVLALNDSRFMKLTSATVPTYHPNCRHRLIPITKAIAESILRGKVA